MRTHTKRQASNMRISAARTGSEVGRQRIENLFELLTGYDYRIVDSGIQKYEGTDYGDYLCVAD